MVETRAYPSFVFFIALRVPEGVHGVWGCELFLVQVFGTGGVGVSLWYFE